MTSAFTPYEKHIHTLLTQEIWEANSSIEKIKTLLDKAPTVLEEKNTQTSLVEASLVAGDKNIVLLFLNYNFDVNQKTQSGVSYLYKSRYMPEVFKSFLDKGALLHTDEMISLKESHPTLSAIYEVYVEKLTLDSSLTISVAPKKIKI